MNGLLWLVFRRCGCPLCLPWVYRAFGVAAAACLTVVYTAACAWTSGAAWAVWLLYPAAAAGTAAAFLGAWPWADHAGDDLEAIIAAIRDDPPVTRPADRKGSRR